MSKVEKNVQSMIFKKYDIKTQDIILERNKGRAIWFVNTEKGKMILKKFSRPEPWTKFIIAGMEYLGKNGINISKIYFSSENKPYTVYNSSCYILMEVIDGRPPRYNNMDDLKAIVKELGKFHNASKGFVPPDDSGGTIDLLGKWPNMMMSGLKIMYYAYEIGKWEKRNLELRDVIVRELPYLIERTKQIILALKDSKYTSWVERARKEGSLCHLDYARYNLRITPNNKVYIFDFDTLAMELPVTDIRKLIYHIYYTNLYDKETISKVLSWYQQCNPLTKEEWQVAKLILLYPIEVIISLEKYIKINRHQDKNRIMNLAIKAIETEKRLYSDLKNFDKVVNKIVMKS
mgnify:FL=1